MSPYSYETKQIYLKINSATANKNQEFGHNLGPTILTVGEIPEQEAQGAFGVCPLLSRGSWASAATGSLVDLGETSRIVDY